MALAQPSLFGDEARDLNPVDEMFAADLRYRSREQFQSLLDFLARFPQYSPFNGLLMYTQNPAATFVATAGGWQRRFDRRPKSGARPMAILAPMAPVLFLYDVSDTEGGNFPVELSHRPPGDGKLRPTVWENTVLSCRRHRIELRETDLGRERKPDAVFLDEQGRKKCAAHHPLAESSYLVLLDAAQPLEDRYSVLVHQLARIFCGHLADTDDGWWTPTQSRDPVARRLEAESAGWLVCRRQGLVTGFDSEHDSIPTLSLNAVLRAIGYIEEMGARAGKKSRRAGRSSSTSR